MSGITAERWTAALEFHTGICVGVRMGAHENTLYFFFGDFPPFSFSSICFCVFISLCHEGNHFFSRLALTDIHTLCCVQTRCGKNI